MLFSVACDRVNAVRCASSRTAFVAFDWPGLDGPAPLVAVAGPDQYRTALPGIVFAPDVKPVGVTEAVQFLAWVPRVSLTRRMPSRPEIVPPGAAAPRLAEAGTLIEGTCCSGTTASSWAADAACARATPTTTAANATSDLMTAPGKRRRAPSS